MALTQEDLQAIAALLEPMRADILDLKQGQAKLERGQAMLEQGQASTNTRLDSMQEHISELRQDVKKLHDTTSRIEKVHGQKINGLFESVVGTGEKFSRLDLVEGKVEDHEHRLFAVEESLKKAE